MEKRIALLVVGLIGVCFFSSTVLALSPMGPPKASLGQNQWAVGIDYANETMDLEASSRMVTTQMDDPPFVYPNKVKHEIEDMKSNIILARVGYGISENWDAFVRLGMADGEAEIEQTYSNGDTEKFKGYDGNFGFAWGFGTRATFWQDNKVTWGGLFQMTWVAPDSSDISLSGDPEFSGDAEMEMLEVQISIGPTWEAADNFSVYGGPFMHFIDGDLDISYNTVLEGGLEERVKSSGDIEEKSQFGGYVGASWDVREDIACYLEGQFTGDAWGIGLGAVRRF